MCSCTSGKIRLRECDTSKVVRSCEQLDPVSTYLRPKFIEFCILLKNSREDKNGPRWTTTFGFDNGRKISKIFCEIKLLFIFETISVVYLRLFYRLYDFRNFANKI